ncbi:MAG: Periplasmic murein peptide-binding protein [Cryomorphaceae bacterium]|nr:MAG: Periplasmic murein peptide-binding protein [Cryomorphaceae bacterium]
MNTFRFLVLLVASTLLWACAAPTPSDKQVFRYNEPTGIPTLDPAFARDKSTIWAVQQLYEGLVRLDENNRVVPALAKSWHISEDGLTYTFTLRSTTFHSGRAVTAADVMYSFNRLTDPAVASPGSWVLERVSHLQAPNDSTVILQLSHPFSSFLSLLTMPYCSVVDTEAAEAGKLATSGGGSGPFKFHVWHFGEKLIFHRNPNYWSRSSAGQQLPLLDGIAISFLPDEQSAFLEFLSGRFDMLGNIAPSFKDDVLQQGTLAPKYQEVHRLERSPFLNTEYLVFNAEKQIPQPLRWAVNAAIDRELMMRTLRSGAGSAATGGFIPKGLPGHAEGAGIRFDKDSAAAVVAGFEELPELVLTTVANYRDLCEFVQGALSDIGWNIEVNVVPSATLRSEKSKGTLDFFRASWIADYPDAENYLMLFAGANKAPAGPNYSRYARADFDLLFEQLSQETDAQEREELSKAADRMLMQDAACVPLYYDEVLRVFPKRVRGVKTNALNALLLHEAEL